MDHDGPLSVSPPQGSPDEARLLLAIESATAQLSVALLRGETLLAEASSSGQHAEWLLPLIEQVLARAGAEEPEVDAFAVSIGPGSFTSLRVGLATVKGLAFGTDRPVARVCTLAALALRHEEIVARQGTGGTCAALLDARRGEAYAAVFGMEPEGPRELRPPGLFTPAELAPHLPAGCVLVGEGARIFGPELQQLTAEAPVIVADADGPPTAACVGVLGARALRRGEAGRAGDLVPHYVRRAEAEVTRTASDATTEGRPGDRAPQIEG